MAKGRPRKAGKREKNGRLQRDPFKTEQPCDRVTQLREAFAFVRPSKGLDGRQGTIDQDICDGIGQLHALGLLDGYGHDPIEIRDIGREYAALYWGRNPELHPKAAKLERSSRSSNSIPGLGEWEEARFLRLDRSMDWYDKQAVVSLCIDPWFNAELVPWAQAIVNEHLLKRKHLPLAGFMPSMDDYARLSSAINGLCCMVEAVRERRAA